MRRIAPLLLLLSAVSPVAACSICGGTVQARQTLREHYQAAAVVLQGKLKNPRFDPSGIGGTTELHVEAAVKPDPKLGKVVTLHRYYPVVGDTPADYLVFGAVADGKFDPTFGVTATAAVAEYLTAAAKLPADDPVRRLGFFFAHLDAVDPTVSADAFLEFAKAPDADIVRAKAALDPAKLRKLLLDPRTPDDRLGVYAMMLGLCGGPADAKALAGLLTGPPSERVASNLSGMLAGYALLDPKAGWAAAEAALSDGKRPFAEQLAAVGMVRFFQSARPDAKPDVLRCYRGLIRRGDLADLAIDDLRRWGWWELTADVLAVASTEPPPPAIVRRAAVRYALTCPADAAKRYVAAARQRDPKLVADVEDALRLSEPGPK